MNARVLCVDDEPRVLDGLELHLGMEHEVHLATSGSAGLDTLEEHGPFDVVISDMRMPGMDGAAFLAKVCEHSPDTMRILLTGQADLNSALRAVNEGRIFRFLTKPCDPDVLLRSIAEATEMRRLRGAEQELLENTLQGCVEVLVEVLGVAVPIAFRRAHRVREIVRRLAPLGTAPDQRWQLEVAALLTNLGSIAVPIDLIERQEIGQHLSDKERLVLEQIPRIGARLVRKIPRLEGAAELVEHARPSLEPTKSIDLRILQTALWVERATNNGDMSWDRATLRVKREVSPEFAGLLGDEPSTKNSVERAIPAKDIRMGMHICEDIYTLNDQCIVRAGTDVTQTLALRLHTFADNIGLKEPIRVRLGD